jgi:aldehyde dehydrogenase (NAD+)
MSNVKEYQHFINGGWKPGLSGEMMDVINPANGEVVARVPKGNDADVDIAIKAAKASFESGVWSEKPVKERVKVLYDVAAELKKNVFNLAYLETVSSGCTIRKALKVDAASVIFKFHNVAKLLERLPMIHHMEDMAAFPMHSYTRVEPIGVCALISPWNFPLLIGLGKLAYALAMGNSVVIKPASITPITTLEVAKIISDAGVPAGVVNCVTGPGSSLGDYLAGHRDVDMVSFTGSTEVGRQIIRLSAETIKRVGLELGGKSALIILDDADLEVAINVSLLAFLLHSGQICESGTRLFVPWKMQDALVEGMIEKIKKLKIGNTLDPQTDIGPVISAAQRMVVEDYVAIGLNEGAELAYGGKRLTGPEYDKGFFFEPTILKNCNNQMAQVREEIFGPVQCVIPYDNLNEAIAMANDSTYGLGGGVVSRDVARAQKVASKLRTGTVWINTWHMMRDDAPFGGYKQSGIGRDMSFEGLMEYAEIKHVCQSLVYESQNTLPGLVLGINK